MIEEAGEIVDLIVEFVFVDFSHILTFLMCN